MMMALLEGTAWVLGDHVNTDVIIAAKYLVSSDPKTLALHCFESIDPDIARRFQPGDIVVAGENFGCGSSREHAVLALLGLRAACVIARSYGQIFYRNAFNQGLLLLDASMPSEAVRAGDRLQVDVARTCVKNLSQQREFAVSPVPEVMQAIINAGGLIPYVLRKRTYR
jgi:3-isopropylmalate/(R)-2-methylmalate dehydratase small subunit